MRGRGNVPARVAIFHIIADIYTTILHDVLLSCFCVLEYNTACLVKTQQFYSIFLIFFCAEINAKCSL